MDLRSIYESKTRNADWMSGKRLAQRTEHDLWFSFNLLAAPVITLPCSR